MKIPHLTILLLTLILSGCSMANYYTQSIEGQLNLLQQREPIDELIANKNTPEKLKKTLQHVKNIRRFSIEKLYLPDNKSYLYYTDLKRPYVVWNVFAAPEFSLSAKNWCYFIVGCVSYRGYFEKQDAVTHANKLNTENYDVSISGIAAYSTLGWFDDPVLNTMLGWKEHHLAGLIFHELSHQILYVKNETAFNEAFSTAAQRMGTIEWLLTTKPDEVTHYLDYLNAYNQFQQLLEATRNKLATLYATNESEQKKRKEKYKIIEAMKLDYQILKEEWPGNISFDRWFERPINNSRFTSTMTYLEHVPAFLTLFKEVNGVWVEFYQAVKNLSELENIERNKQLESLKSREIAMSQIVELIKNRKAM